MSREVVAILYCHNSLISLVGLDCQKKLLMRTDVKRREIWEWSDHTPKKSAMRLIISIELIQRAVAVDIDSTATEVLGW